MQKRNANRTQSKKFHPTLPDLCLLYPTWPDILRQLGPTISTDAQLLYISRLISYAPTHASQSLITAHRAIFVCCSHGIKKTLVNSRKRSSNTYTRMPVTHRVDNRSAMYQMRASAPKAFMCSKT